MAETTAGSAVSLPARPAGGRMKFIIGGVLMLVAVAVLLITTLSQQQEVFTTVDEIVGSEAALAGRSLRITGAVIGDTIRFDGETLHMEFDIVHIPTGINEEVELAEALHLAVSNPDASRLRVVMDGEPKPDLLKHEAQAIITGELMQQADGSYVFMADELLLKCPTRYDEALPEEAEDN